MEENREIRTALQESREAKEAAEQQHRLVSDLARQAQTSHDTMIELYEKAMEEGRPFDVVIMDLTIPGELGGKETVGRLRELDPDAKVIVSSGYSDDPVMSRFREYGFDGVLVKPYKVADLAEVIRKVLSGR